MRERNVQCSITYLQSIQNLCLVLYLSIYIAPLAVHTNQRRSQCERPREKKEVFRQRKEALGPPVNKQERVKGGSCFHSAGTAGPMKAKARVLAIAVWTHQLESSFSRAVARTPQFVPSTVSQEPEVCIN